MLMRLCSNRVDIGEKKQAGPLTHMPMHMRMYLHTRMHAHIIGISVQIQMQMHRTSMRALQVYV